MNELDLAEAHALRDAVLLGGGSVATVGGAICFTHPRTPMTELNRAVPVGPVVDVAAIASWFRGRDAELFDLRPARVPRPRRAARRARLHSRRRVDEVPPERRAGRTRPRPTCVSRRRAIAAPSRSSCGEGLGIPAELAFELSALVGATGWHCFVAWDGDEPAGGGALYVDGEVAWLGIGATRPPYRGRGSQSAILAARIEAARAARREAARDRDRRAGRAVLPQHHARGVRRGVPAAELAQPRVSRLAPLRGRDFRLLFIARTTSRLGSAMAPVALAFAVLNTLHGTATDLGIILAARLIPTVCFILLGGVLGDRLPRNVVMVGSNLVSGASQATTAVAASDRSRLDREPRAARCGQRSLVGVLHAGERRDRPADRRRRGAPGGERAPPAVGERDQHPRRGARRPARCRHEPGLGDRGRRERPSSSPHSRPR